MKVFRHVPRAGSGPPRGRSAAPEFGHIAGPLTPAPNQVGTFAEQMARTHVPRSVEERRQQPVTWAELEAFVAAALASVRDHQSEPLLMQPAPICQRRYGRGVA